MHTVLRVWATDRLRGLESNIVAIGSFLCGERISRQHISPSPEMFIRVPSRALPRILFFVFFWYASIYSILGILYDIFDDFYPWSHQGRLRHRSKMNELNLKYRGDRRDRRCSMI